METPTSPSSGPNQRSEALLRQAAKASWASTLVALAIVVLGSRTGAKVILELVAITLILVGFAAGIVALIGLGRHRIKGVASGAVAGLVANSLLILIFVTNFQAARARARSGTETLAAFQPVAPVATDTGSQRIQAARAEARSGTEPLETIQPVAPVATDTAAQRSYRGDLVAFDYDRAYQLREKQDTGQILLEHPDSYVLVTCLGQVVDVSETLNKLSSVLQEDFRQQAYRGVAQKSSSSIEGSLRSGGVVRLEYERSVTGRMNVDVYILSDPTNSISVLHYFPVAKASNAERLSQTVLRSLKDTVEQLK